MLKYMEETSLLKEMHDQLWEFHLEYPGVLLGFTDEDLVYATKIFSSVLFEMAFVKKIKNFNSEKMGKTVEFLGSSLRDFVLQTTGVDPYEFYQKEHEDEGE